MVRVVTCITTAVIQIECIPILYKLKIKYGYFFKTIKNDNRQKYYFGKLRTLILSIGISFDELLEEFT
jgi:hypothetical protein